MCRYNPLWENDENNSTNLDELNSTPWYPPKTHTEYYPTPHIILQKPQNNKPHSRISPKKPKSYSNFIYSLYYEAIVG